MKLLTLMKWINSWGNPHKHGDKFIWKLRLGKLTVWDLIIDISSKQYSLTVMNFTVRL